jgi:hypothetical protein
MEYYNWLFFWQDGDEFRTISVHVFLLDLY